SGWDSFFSERLPGSRTELAQRLRALTEERLFPEFMRGQRWYAGKGVALERARFDDHALWQTAHGDWLMSLVTAVSDDAETRYFLPLTVVFEDTDEARWRRLQPAAVARVRQKDAMGVLADATQDDAFCQA